MILLKNRWKYCEILKDGDVILLDGIGNSQKATLKDIKRQLKPFNFIEKWRYNKWEIIIDKEYNLMDFIKLYIKINNHRFIGFNINKWEISSKFSHFLMYENGLIRGVNCVDQFIDIDWINILMLQCPIDLVCKKITFETFYYSLEDLVILK